VCRLFSFLSFSSFVLLVCVCLFVTFKPAFCIFHFLRYEKSRNGSGKTRKLIMDVPFLGLINLMYRFSSKIDKIRKLIFH